MRGARAALVGLVGWILVPGAALAPALAGAAAPQATFAPEAVKSALSAHIERLLREGGGSITLQHPVTGEDLHLAFEDIAVVSAEALWRIHDPRRTYEGRGYFACTTFHDAGGGALARRFDVDYLLVDRSGHLEVAQALVHKEARLADGKWAWQVLVTKEKLAGE